jgi:hypothetical protein
MFRQELIMENIWFMMQNLGSIVHRSKSENTILEEQE